MVQLTYPGVYIREVPSGARTITGVATSIAAFVGMAKDGPLDTPTLVLGFRDYVRTFSEDTSEGEMTDQVRQFFLNGGQQAYITRIADGALPATFRLPAVEGDVEILLRARNAGTLGDFLRVTVDYDTATPESTFNLTVFRERVDASGNVTTVVTETHGNVSMDPASVRNVALVVNNNSALVTAAIVDPGTEDPIAAEPNASYSLSALLRADEAGLQQALYDAIPAAPAVAKLRMRLGTSSATIAVNRSNLANNTPADVFGDLAAFIGTFFPGATVTIAAQVLSTGVAALRFSATDGTDPLDIAIERAPDSDITVPLGLGVAQGGIERGAFSNARPAPHGLVAQLYEPADTHIELLAALAALDKNPTWTAPNPVLVINGSNSISVDPGDIEFPVTTGNLYVGSAVETENSLLNVRENLQAIVNAINASTTEWRATLQGYRIALRFTAGSAASGAGHTFMTAPAAFSAMFVTPSTAVGDLFSGGDDGDPPGPQDYQRAYDELAKVDIFNLLILPRNRDDEAPGGNRLSLWGPASAFAQSERAFLLMDAPNGTDTVAKARDAVVNLRTGIVKDHSALYWPRVRIDPDGNPRFIDASGTIAGIMSRIDSTRGVWKAPAGIEADLRAVIGVEVPMSDPENGTLNPRALNAIRAFTNGIVSWGARTMDGFDNSGNDDYKYVPVRRFTLFLSESLVRGLKFAVFEPNDEPLWGQIRLAAGAFMNNLFRLGAFAGRSARDSYFVKCDAETTTQNDINLGIVNVIVGFAPLKPAEFVVITIQQKAGQVQV